MSDQNSTKKKEPINRSVALSLPVTLVDKFKKNLEERGFTERGDFSHEVNKALHLYLEHVGAFEILDEHCKEEAALEAVLSVFTEAEDLD